MTLEQEWIENDLNPFILFDSKGKVKSLNTEAQFLLGHINASRLFELATTYASPSFGFKTSMVDFDFDHFHFYALTVGYLDEESIGIRLYTKPKQIPGNLSIEGEKVNIYTLIDLCIASKSISSTRAFTKQFDPSIPELHINTELFIQALNKLFDLTVGKVFVSVNVKVGEAMRIAEKKYPLLDVLVNADAFEENEFHMIEEICANEMLMFNSSGSICSISLPMVVK